MNNYFPLKDVKFNYKYNKSKWVVHDLRNKIKETNYTWRNPNSKISKLKSTELENIPQ